MGLLGEIYAAVAKVGWVDPSRPASFINSSLWLIFGVGLVLLSRRIGRWLGSGLG